MDVRLLRYFHAVAKLKSFSKAAEVLCISQPALSQGVKGLETELHCKLFIRGKALQLTLEGEKLFSHCWELFQVLESIVEDIADAKNPRKGVVTVGVLDSVLLYWLPAILGTFFLKFPNVSVSFEKSETTAIESSVLDDKFHIGIISRPAFSLKLEEEELGSFSHKLVVSSEFTDDLATLAGRLPLYVLGNWQEDVLKARTKIFEQFPEIQILNPSNCVGLIRQIVAKKLGMAVLPSYAVGSDLRVVEEFPLMKMGLYLIRKKKHRPNPVVDQFIEFLKSYRE